MNPLTEALKRTGGEWNSVETMDESPVAIFILFRDGEVWRGLYDYDAGAWVDGTKNEEFLQSEFAGWLPVPDGAGE